MLFLLDQVLHGIKSYDRRIGAEAVVRALVARGAIGLVTTHDLALTELPAARGPVAANVHFEDRIEHGRIVFDDTMRPGIVERSNALALMRAVGLDVQGRASPTSTAAATVRGSLVERLRPQARGAAARQCGLSHQRAVSSMAVLMR